MRRSEMINKLAKVIFKRYLKNQPISNIDKDDFKLFKKELIGDAKVVLSFLEKQGMLPPKTHASRLTSNEAFAAMFKNEALCAWEPEDEKK